jgi:hypothetical protein
MPYNDAKTRMTRAFSSQSNSTSQRPPRPATYTVEVSNYDLSSQAVIGKRLDEGFQDQILEVSINANTVARQRDRDKAKAASSQVTSDAGSFCGAYVDDKMSQALPAGSIIVVERGVRQKTLNVGNESRQVIEANWIHHLPDDNLDKLIDAPLAGTSFGGRLRQIQAYVGKKSHSVQTETGEAAISALADQMDQDVETYNPDEFKPRVGVRFVAVRATDRTKDRWSAAEKKMLPQPIVEQVDSSFRYDWIDLSEENAPREERKGRPMNGAEMIESLNGYIQYIDERFNQGVADKDKVHVEVRPYVTYFASKTDNSFDANPAGKNFVGKLMANSLMKLAQGEDEQYYAGGNYGVNGKLMLVKDKTHKGQIVHQYLAGRIFLDGFHAPIDELIPTEDGATVELIKELRPQQTERQQNAAAAGAPAGGGAPAQEERFQSTLAASHEDDPVATTDDAFGGDDHYRAAFESADAPAADAPDAAQPPAAAEPARQSRLRR